jgi:hydrogenase maturation protein HypF
MPQLLAVGSELKNTFTFTRANEAFVSQHLGDMEHVASFDNWLETKNLYEKLFHLKPAKLVCDLHPEYLLSKWAREQALPRVEVQHHHAHVVAAMAENELEGPVCGFAFDGTGYGVDGAIWGGEVLLANLQAFERFANVAYFPLPGGAQAIRHTDRCAFGVLWSAGLLEHPFAQRFFADKEQETTLMNKMIEGGINTPFASSMGRIFDAASALLGICSDPRYEGEAAILLEAAITKGFGPQAAAHMSALRAGAASGTTAEKEAAELQQLERYQFGLLKNTATDQSTAQDTSVLLIDPAPVFEALLDDLETGVEKPLIARRFHEAVVAVILTLAEAVRAFYDINEVTLSGGVFMNRYLMERVLGELQEAGFTVALNRELPPNDASVSYGQAVIGLHSNEEGQ